jgi:fucose 4-O-acetylase-like acetyltransferase
MGSSSPLASGLDAGLGARDRVLDAVKAFALVVVVVGHGLEWDTSTGSPAAVLDQRPGLVWVTWIAQVLPLFFAAGAVANAVSWHRDPDVAAYLRRRMVRLATPGLVYTAVWTVLLLPLALLVPLAGFAGRFLAELVWFLAVYAAATAAVPWTTRWTRRPWLSVGLWLGAIIAVDLLRWNVWAPLGWLNLVLVWAFVHQVGYHLPALREARRAWLVSGSVVAVAAAVGLGVLGPYSSSMVSFGGDPEPSNLAPPTLVVALYGLGQILLLAALWPWLVRRLAADQTYRAVGAVGSRAIGIYLWHIPFVALVAGAAWGLGFTARPLGLPWWLAHVLGLAVILPAAWGVAGPAAAFDRWARTWATQRRPWTHAVVPFAAVIPLVLCSISVTGFGTWWGPGMLDMPSSSVLNLAVLALAWFALAARGQSGRPGTVVSAGDDVAPGPAPRHPRGKAEGATSSHREASGVVHRPASARTGVPDPWTP